MKQFNFNILPYADTAHKDFFLSAITKMKSDNFQNAVLFAYLMSACVETREQFWELWADYQRDSSSDYWVEVMESFKWQLDVRRCIALAANLCGDGGFCAELTPAYLYDSDLAPVFLAAVLFWFYHKNAFSDKLGYTPD